MSDINHDIQGTQQDPIESPVWIAALFVLAVVFLIIGIAFNSTAFGQSNFKLWTGLLGLLATVAIFSVLYKENPIFRFFEHIFVGLAVGFGIVAGWIKIIEPNWYYPMMPKQFFENPDAAVQMANQEKAGGLWLLFLALPIGLTFFTVYFSKISWMNRFTLSILMGWSAGTALQAFIGGLAPQVVAAFRPPVTVYNTADVKPGLNNIELFGVHVHLWWLISIIVLTCTMAYFFFSVDHGKAGWIRRPAKVGRYVIMIALGTIFGTTVMGRFSLLIERLDNVMGTIGQWSTVVAHWFVSLFR